MDDAAAAASPPPSSSRPLWIVLCPWLALGHLLPYLELAERLASRGHRVSFVSTPRNLARLPPPLRDGAAGGAIDHVALQLPCVDGLPAGAESTNDIPTGDKLDPLFEAFDGLAAPFADYLAAGDDTTRPDWVLADTLSHWAAAVAIEHGVPCAMLMPTVAAIAALGCGAAGRGELDPAAAGSVFEQMLAVEEARAAMPHFEWVRKMPLLAPTAGASSAAMSMSIQGRSQDLASSQAPARPPCGSAPVSILGRASMTLERCTVAAIRSCPEWELDAFPLATALLGRPLIPLGLLPPPPPPSPDGGEHAADMHRDDDAAVRWLDAQPAKSVVYVALGSEVPLPVELVCELALGLELAGTRFLWALRKPRGVADADVVPASFEERTHGHGLVTMGWVPQTSILAHGAVGAFLTHCGRSSLILGLLYGHPLIMLPIATDQGPNARLMEGRKVGLQVPRDEDDGSFDRHGVASVVRAVMVEEDTRRVFVANAKKMQEIVADRELHERYLDEFVEQLRSYITDGSSFAPAEA
ncbi:unnamed protein product [Urochloa decumbens]|uniref:Glycosyltransferase n=1 Tax=Urochloa decumbens TaxID=240449 RepID=A0ABC9AHF5_9POAL